jgi:hypothetical protein
LKNAVDFFGEKHDQNHRRHETTDRKSTGQKKYCVWATTSQEGYPDLSFRGSTFVYDDEHLAFWDRSLGQSTTNLERNPHVCMLYYDQPGRTGWRFFATFVFFVCSFEKDFEGMLLQHGQVFGPSYP